MKFFWHVLNFYISCIQRTIMKFYVEYLFFWNFSQKKIRINRYFEVEWKRVKLTLKNVKPNFHLFYLKFECNFLKNCYS